MAIRQKLAFVMGGDHIHTKVAIREFGHSQSRLDVSRPQQAANPALTPFNFPTTAAKLLKSKVKGAYGTLQTGVTGYKPESQ